MADSHTLHPSFRPCRDYLLAALPLVALSTYIYSWRPLIMVALACVTALICDLLTAALRRLPFEPSDLSSYVFVIVFTLLLPASVSYHIVIVGSAVVTLLGKQAFGGYECYPFSPPAFGFAFVSVCWPNLLFKYPQPFGKLSLAFDSGATLYDAPAYALKYHGIPYVETSDLFLGNFAGPMGATFCLVILAILFFLIEHHTISGHVSISFLLTCSAFAYAFPRITAPRWQSVIYEMLSGCLVFAAIFMAEEPSTAPKNRLAKVVYGFVLGIATMLFRYYGVFEIGFCFALLLVSPLAGLFDRKLSPRHGRRSKKEDVADA